MPEARGDVLRAHLFAAIGASMPDVALAESEAAEWERCTTDAARALADTLAAAEEVVGTAARA